MIWRVAACALLLLLVTSPALGQGCAMCAQSASAADAAGQRALARGVAILLVPPLGMLVGLVGLAFWYRPSEARRHPLDFPSREKVGKLRWR